MDTLSAIRDVVWILIIGAVLGVFIYFVLRMRRGEKIGRSVDKGVDFHPTIGFTRLDGGRSVAVLLDNRSDARVWIEEIEIVLTDLIANQQTSDASCHETHKIHQTVRGQDMLPVSLVETIYRAAGKPQRKYSCVLSSIVRYRVEERWYEEAMKAYRLSMVGLTVAGIRRESKTVYRFKPRVHAQELQTVDAGPK